MSSRCLTSPHVTMFLGLEALEDINICSPRSGGLRFRCSRPHLSRQEYSSHDSLWRPLAISTLDASILEDFTNFLRENEPCLFGLLVSPEKYEKLNSSRTEWRTCTFLHTVPRSMSPLELRQTTQVSTLLVLSAVLLRWPAQSEKVATSHLPAHGAALGRFSWRCKAYLRPNSITTPARFTMRAQTNSNEFGVFGIN